MPAQYHNAAKRRLIFDRYFSYFDVHWKLPSYRSIWRRSAWGRLLLLPSEKQLYCPLCDRNTRLEFESLTHILNRAVIIAERRAGAAYPTIGEPLIGIELDRALEGTNGLAVLSLLVVGDAEIAVCEVL